MRGLKQLTPLFKAFKLNSTRALHSKPVRLSAASRLASPYVQKLHPTEIQGVIVDFSGTWVDGQVLGPTKGVQKVFDKHGVPITVEEARAPMGLRKDLHIIAILNMPSVQARWLSVKGSMPTKEDFEKIYADFVPMLLEVLPEYGAPIQGVVETVKALRTDNIKIGCTTGFTRVMVDKLLTKPQKKALLDSSTTGDEVLNGSRPCPHMLFKEMDNLGIHSPMAVFKVGDTGNDVGEGLNAGSWTGAVFGSSNLTGIKGKEHLAKMPKKELEERQEYAKQELSKFGPHYLMKYPSEILTAVKDINKRMKRGETPTSALTEKPKSIFYRPLKMKP